MRDRRDEGLWTWKQAENNNRMIAFQQGAMPAPGEGPVEIAYFAGSAFRVTSPAGVSIMIDPWRNPPWGNWDWYHHDFPAVEVDIGVSTHAHFDHDGLHFLRASTLIDRPTGTYAFADVRIIGVADKHVSDSSHNAYDWAEMTRRLSNVGTRPPDNWRSFDNCIVIIEVGGLRILHWGDNRPDPPEAVWDLIGPVDVALLPVDGSQHVLSYSQADAIARRLAAKVVIPHHYAIWDVTTRASTLLPPDEWVNARSGSRWLRSGTVTIARGEIAQSAGVIWCFGEHVAFDKLVGGRTASGA